MAFEFPFHREDFAKAVLQESREAKGCGYRDVNPFIQRIVHGKVGSAYTCLLYHTQEQELYALKLQIPKKFRYPVC